MRISHRQEENSKIAWRGFFESLIPMSPSAVATSTQLAVASPRLLFRHKALLKFGPMVWGSNMELWA
jgi:hypothetical protein